VRPWPRNGVSYLTDIAVAKRKNLLGDEEQALLDALTDPRNVVTVVIPDTIETPELMSNLRLCCGVWSHLEKVQRKISPLIGRILMILHDNPERYQSLGYKDFKDFIVRFVETEMGCSHSSAYQAMRLVRIFPDLPLNVWEELGSRNIHILSKFTKDTDPSFPKYLAAARQINKPSAFLEWAANKNLIQKGEGLYTRAVIINMTIPLSDAWKKFKRDGRVHSITGSEADGVIFESMLAECSASWLLEDLEVEKTPPPVVGTLHGFCGLCKAKWQMGIPERISLHDLRGLVYDHHKEQSPGCEEGASNLIIQRPAGVIPIEP
jgi:hypothetical protein